MDSVKIILEVLLLSLLSFCWNTFVLVDINGTDSNEVDMDWILLDFFCAFLYGISTDSIIVMSDESVSPLLFWIVVDFFIKDCDEGLKAESSMSSLLEMVLPSALFFKSPNAFPITLSISTIFLFNSLYCSSIYLLFRFFFLSLSIFC